MKFLAILASVIIIGFLCYIIGFGHGQSSAYKKQNDDVKLMDIYMDKHKKDIDKE